MARPNRNRNGNGNGTGVKKDKFRTIKTVLTWAAGAVVGAVAIRTFDKYVTKAKEKDQSKTPEFGEPAMANPTAGPQAIGAFNPFAMTPAYAALTPVVPVPQLIPPMPHMYPPPNYGQQQPNLHVEQEDDEPNEADKEMGKLLDEYDDLNSEF